MALPGKAVAISTALPERDKGVQKLTDEEFAEELARIDELELEQVERACPVCDGAGSVGDHRVGDERECPECCGSGEKGGRRDF
jgi:hypothetical protein